MAKEYDVQSLDDLIVGALLVLRNASLDKRREWFEGVVDAKIAGDTDHLMVKWSGHTAPVKMRVIYMTCDADAYAPGDFCLIYAPQCNTGAAKVVGFTRKAKPCIAIEGELFGLTVPSMIERTNSTLNIEHVVDFELEVVEDYGGIIDMSGIGVNANREGVDRFEGAFQADFAFEPQVYIDATGACTAGFTTFERSLERHIIPVKVPVVPGASHGVGFGLVNPTNDFVGTCVCVPNTPDPGCTNTYFPDSASFTGLVHGDHGHFGATSGFPITSITKTATDLGESLSLIYATGPGAGFVGARNSSDPIRVSFVGLEHTGLSSLVLDPTGDVYFVSEGRLGAGLGSPGVLLTNLETGVTTQLWTSAISDVFDVATWDATYPSCSDTTINCTVARDQIDVFVRFVRFTRLRDELIVGMPSPPIYVKDSDPLDSYILFQTLIRDYRFEARPLTGVPSPPTCLDWVSPTDPGLNGGRTPATDSIVNEDLAVQGHVEEKLRLYSLNARTNVVTMISETNVLHTTPDFTSGTQTALGEKRYHCLEAKTQWRRNIYARGGGDDNQQLSTSVGDVTPWFNPVGRADGVTVFTGGGFTDHGEQDPAGWTGYPFCSPPGDVGAFHLLNPGVGPDDFGGGGPLVRPCSNWMPLNFTTVPRVAAWSHDAYYTTPSPAGRAFDTLYDGRINHEPRDAGGSLTDQFCRGQLLMGQGPLRDFVHPTKPPQIRFWEDYPHDPPRKCVAATDHFAIYNAQTGALIDEIITGYATNPPGYITAPCITPDGRKVLFVAHGVFSIPGIASGARRFYAGMYYLDRTGLLLGGDASLTFVSPCELRVPSGQTILASRPGSIGVPALATGSEISHSPATPYATAATPTLEESRIAFWVGSRRKSFTDRAGTSVIAESGMMLNVATPAQPLLSETFLASAFTGAGAPFQVDYAGLWRCYFTPGDE